MSGGTFDLSHFELTDFSEDLQRWVDEERDSVPPFIRERLLNLAFQVGRLAPLVRAADLYASGDLGDETFNEAWKEAQSE